jgi:hypothetical protein
MRRNQRFLKLIVVNGLPKIVSVVKAKQVLSLNGVTPANCPLIVYGKCFMLEWQ